MMIETGMLDQTPDEQPENIFPEDDTAPADDGEMSSSSAESEETGKKHIDPGTSRLHDLNEAIQNSPDSAACYLLRGEYFLSTRQFVLANADFEKALELAAQEIETSRWGIIAQGIMDRALQGLERTDGIDE